MRSIARLLRPTVFAALIGATAGCGAPTDVRSLCARAPDGSRIAVATAGARNVRVLHVSGPSIVRLREIFVPQGEAITAIAWSDDGRELMVATRGPMYAVDTRTWRITAGADDERRLAQHRARGH